MAGRRGHEPNVKCDQCGRHVRRDKAVFIQKMVFANPIERKDVVDESYSRGTYREVCYCPSCGKHLRVYEKKKRMLEKQRERENSRGTFQRSHRTFDARAIYGLLPPREEAPAPAPAPEAAGAPAQVQEAPVEELPPEARPAKEQENQA